MGMEATKPIIQIIDGPLVIDIDPEKYPKLAAAMSVLDKNGDHKITTDDFYETVCESQDKCTTADVRKRFREEVVNVFVDNDFMKPIQGLGMLKFFDIYGEVKEQAELMVDWKKNHTDNGGIQLEFSDTGYWEEKVRPQFVLGGMFYNDSLDRDFLAMIYYLSDAPAMDLQLKDIENGDEKVKWLGYNPAYIPKIIRNNFKEFMSWRKSSEEFLHRYTYVQCDGGNCPSVFGFAVDEYPISILWTYEDEKWRPSQ